MIPRLLWLAAAALATPLPAIARAQGELDPAPFVGCYRSESAGVDFGTAGASRSGPAWLVLTDTAAEWPAPLGSRMGRMIRTAAGGPATSVGFEWIPEEDSVWLGIHAIDGVEYHLVRDGRGVRGEGGPMRGRTAPESAGPAVRGRSRWPVSARKVSCAEMPRIERAPPTPAERAVAGCYRSESPVVRFGAPRDAANAGVGPSWLVLEPRRNAFYDSFDGRITGGDPGSGFPVSWRMRGDTVHVSGVSSFTVAAFRVQVQDGTMSGEGEMSTDVLIRDADGVLTPQRSAWPLAVSRVPCAEVPPSPPDEGR